MKARFLHLADCHLGYRQYNNTERYDDFARAFLAIIDVAIDQKVDFVILAGDLFDKRSIEALTLNQAMIGLERLKAANIPCIAVEGNHELSYHNEAIGWMQFLANRRLLLLLHPDFEVGEPQLKPYTNRKGSYVDPVPGLRVHGLRYLGSSTATAVEGYAKALEAQPKDDIQYTIFVAHAGVEGVINEQTGGLSHRQWAVLHPYVDYLALGHIHKPFDFDHWIYNPGSPETCSLFEATWPHRGYYLVEVDTERPRAEDEPKHNAQLHANPRRVIHRLDIKTDLLTLPTDLIAYTKEYLQRKARDFGVNKLSDSQRPVVELQLTGVLPFDRSALDLAALELLVQEAFNPLIALVKNFTHSVDFGVEFIEGVSRLELERRVLSELMNRDTRFHTQSEQWVELTLGLKRLALSNASPEAILDELTGQMAGLQTHS
ncbi:MAG: exonuclease SbcCD subunit D [Chloroflexi bacterium]|nr:exonuclease SbcCD subunit D [Chloroflexota bacterium]